MDSIRILQYDRWKKLNDKVIGKNSVNLASLGNIASSIEPLVNSDGFFNQHIIGGTAKADKQPKNVKVYVYCAQ